MYLNNFGFCLSKSKFFKCHLIASMKYLTLYGLQAIIIKLLKESYSMEMDVVESIIWLSTTVKVANGFTI